MFGLATHNHRSLGLVSTISVIERARYLAVSEARAKGSSQVEDRMVQVAVKVAEDQTKQRLLDAYLSFREGSSDGNCPGYPRRRLRDA